MSLGDFLRELATTDNILATARGGVSGMTAGFSKPLGAGAAVLIDKLVGTGKLTYEEARQIVEEQDRESRNQAPGLYTGAQLVGGLVPASRVAKVASGVKGMAAGSAALGAAQGYHDTGTLEGTLAGAGVGALGGAVGGYLQKPADKLLGAGLKQVYGRATTAAVKSPNLLQQSLSSELGTLPESVVKHAKDIPALFKIAFPKAGTDKGVMELASLTEKEAASAVNKAALNLMGAGVPKKDAIQAANAMLQDKLIGHFSEKIVPLVDKMMSAGASPRAVLQQPEWQVLTAGIPKAVREQTDAHFVKAIGQTIKNYTDAAARQAELGGAGLGAAIGGTIGYLRGDKPEDILYHALGGAATGGVGLPAIASPLLRPLGQYAALKTVGYGSNNLISTLPSTVPTSLALQQSTQSPDTFTTVPGAAPVPVQPQPQAQEPVTDPLAQYFAVPEQAQAQAPAQVQAPDPLAQYFKEQ